MAVSARTAEPGGAVWVGKEAASEKQEAGKEAALVAHRSAHGEVDVPEESIFQTLWLCIFCLALLPPSATPSPARN